MTKVLIPDLGGASDVTIIEILVKPGDQIDIDQPLLTLEGEKATMEVPATQAGEVSSVLVNVGDKVNVGDVIIELSIASTDNQESSDAAVENETQEKVVATSPAPTETNQLQTLMIPDLGGADSAQVIECLVNIGDQIVIDQAIVTLEGEKATMEVPASEAGEVKAIHIKVGDQIKQGQPMIDLMVSTSAVVSPQPSSSEEKPQTTKAETSPEQTPAPVTQSPVKSVTNEPLPSFDQVYAGPSVRRYAREFGIDLNQIKGTGQKGRIRKKISYNL